MNGNFAPARLPPTLLKQRLSTLPTILTAIPWWPRKKTEIEVGERKICYTISPTVNKSFVGKTNLVAFQSESGNIKHMYF
ncbi:hypothetical protein POVWA2_039700 [Plasmodium ovale wallikeri]|uniref:Uncharacterized protein n=1 Tax=Plasmodium ovale wallikeri TaxID=864142 RepID=A0A1A8Z9C7_PLAOA|nr:hypothetical protein POVWA1_041130 [Plasmodium ovale wallikeri]SBT40436.1 hypothetical protein POVWA2_039700 [Plasmodium ovale wallikeri]